MQLPKKISESNELLKRGDYSEAVKSFQHLIKNVYQADDILKEQAVFNLKYSLNHVDVKGLYRDVLPRIAVYTAVVGAYDNLKDPLFRAANVDYYVFSDMEISSKVWKRIPLNYYSSSEVKNARFVKLNPHLYFCDYDASVWVDANIQIIGDINQLVCELPSEKFLGMFSHPHRNCIYVEGAECIKRNKDDPAPIIKQLDCYKNEGYPAERGLWETGILIRRHNDSRCVQVMSDWWLEVFSHSRRDQISLPYVLHNHNESPYIYGKDLRDSLNLLYKKHSAGKSLIVSSDFKTPIKKKIDVNAFSMSIVVCVYNALDDVKECLSSVIKHKRKSDKVIIVDDCSACETEGFLQNFASQHSDIYLVRNEKNKGYTKSANIGLRLSKADYTLLLNSDTIITANVINSLISAGEQSAFVGIVGPLSNAATWQSVPRVKGDDGGFIVNDIPEGFTIDDIGRFIASDNEIVSPMCHLVNGFCYAVKRAVIDKIGILDEESFPVGYGEEDDFSLRALKAGFINCIAVDAFVYHAKSKSFTPEGRKPLAKAGFSNLVKKHGKDFVLLSTETLGENRVMETVRNKLAGFLLR